MTQRRTAWFSSAATLRALLVLSAAAPLLSSCSEGITPPGDSVELFVPGGAFWMGSESDGICDLGDGQSCADESRPRRCVVLSSFKMDQTEVTNLQYRHCQERGWCSKPEFTNSGDHGSYTHDEAFDEYPVVNVTWDQAQQYCRWRGKRLPTEAEWEWAAKGGAAQRNFPWGNEAPKANCDLATLKANYNLCSTASGIDEGTLDGSPLPVLDSRLDAGVSADGIRNLAGNVREWVSDWYYEKTYCGTEAQESYGCADAACMLLQCREHPGECRLSCSGEYFCMAAPEDQAYLNPTGPTEGQYKATRGGRFDSPYACDLETSKRTFHHPAKSDHRLGFRCVRELVPSEQGCFNDTDCRSGRCTDGRCAAEEPPANNCGDDPRRPSAD